MGGKGEIAKLLPVLVLLAVALFGIMFFSGKLGSPTGLAAGGNANLPPEWTASSTKFVLEQNTPVLLNLGNLFNDPEGQPLTFSVAGAKDVSVSLEDNTLSITPNEGFKGTRTVTVIASDGENIVRKQILVEAGSETAQQDVLPESTATTELQPSGFSTSGFQTTASSCGAYGESTTLDQDISNASTCIVITGNDLVFDCAGYSITYCTSGCGSGGRGITVSNHKNVTIQNCRINTSSSGISLTGVQFMQVNESLINNTNITTVYITGATSSNGVSLQSNSKYNTILNSIINVTCESTPCYGVSATGSPYNNITSTRIIVSPASTNGAGIDALNSPWLNISYTDATVNAGGVNSCNGIILRSANQSIHSTNVTINGNNYINAINLTNANNSVVSGSRFTCMASMDSRAVAVDSSENMTFIENRMTVNGSSAVQALSLSNSGGEFSLTSLVLLGPSGAGMSIQNSKGTSFNATTINSSSNSQMWVAMYSNPEKNNFTNTTFMNINGSINILGSFNFTNGYLDQSGLYILNNRAYLNSSNLSELNQTAIIALKNLVLINPHPTVDWNDDGVYENCPADVCSELNRTATSITFNVSHFTSYSTTGTANITGCPITLNSSAILGNDITSDTTCITVNADNVEIDCRGHKIGYNTGGGDYKYGVTASYRNNVTVRNCIINDSDTGGTVGYGVYLNATNNSLVANNTIQSYGNVDNSPVYLQSASYNRIENNSLLPRSSIGEIGLVMTSSTGNNATGNTIATFTLGSSNLGVELTGSTRCRLAYTNITTDGEGGDYGISMATSDNITVEYNKILARGTSASHGINAASGIDNRIIGNNIYAEGNGIHLNTGLHLTTLSFNNITTSSTFAGIYIYYSNLTNATNNGFNTTGHWINSTASYNNSFHNTTFETTGGKINIPYNFTVSGTYDVNRARLLPASTTAKINTVALPFLNTTGIISLYGVGASVPVPTVDYEDDGSYVRCGDVCTELYKSGSTYVFNVTHFTTFSTSETNITGCPVTINESTTLSHSISSNTTCITIGANNLALNCNGSTITFGINGQPQAAGVKADTKINITVANCTIILGNSSARYAHGVNFTSGGNITVINNIIRVNGTGNNTGMHLFYPDYNRLLYNTVMVHGSQDSNYGIRFYASYYNNITGNNVSVNGTTNNVALRLSGLGYSNVSANNATAKGTLGDNYGIYLFSTSTINAIENNKVTVYGDTGLDYGIYLFTTTNWNNITGNTISTSGPGTDYHGIVFGTSAGNNRLNYNNVTVAGSNSYGLYIQSSSNNKFNNTLLNTTAWIYSDFMSTNYFTNTTFVRSHGRILLMDFYLDDLYDITDEIINITNNRTFINTMPYVRLNVSGIITLNNISFIDPKPMASWDDANYVDCPSSVCTELNYAGGAYTFNVSHFTSYASAENTTQITSCPVTINESAVLTQNLISNDTCITINGDSLTLDCAGRTITYNANNGAAAYGIQSTDKSGITIRNCIIVLGNRSSVNSHAVYFIETNNSALQNNTLLVNGTNSDMGIYLSASYNNTIAGNKVFCNSSGTGDHGIFTVSSGGNSIIENNSIVTNSSSTSHGLYIQSGGNRIDSNNITTNGDDSYGLHIAINSQNNSATGNRIVTNGTFSYGIYLLTSSNNNNISSNTIRTRGTDAYSIVMVSSAGNRFESNNITIGALSQYGVYSQLSTANTFNNTVINSTQDWAYIDDSSTANFTATTFQSEKGSVLLDNFTIDSVLYDITGVKLNTSLNRTYLNSSALPALNTSGVITLYDLTAVDPKPMVDWEDDGTYDDCPVCTELSYSGGVFQFNTTHFTSYSSSENSTAVTGCPVTINGSTTLSQDVSSNETCITINGSSMTLDCEGHTITYANQGPGYGIWVANRGRVTIKDCVLVLGNSSATGTRAIYLTNSNYSLMQNNTLLINGTDANDGINLFRSNNNTIIQNIIFANNSGLSNTGIYFGTGSGNNTAEGNSVVMNGTQSNPGIYSYGPGMHRLLYNNVTTYGNYSYGIHLLFTAQNCSIIGNSITTEGSFAYGLNFGTDVNYNNITGNRIVARGDFAHGINLNSLYRNRFEYNNITVNSDTQYGINLQLAPSTFNHTIINSTDNWIYADSLSISEFEDTTFQSEMGSIKLDNFTIPGVVTYDIISGYLNTSHNQSHLDSINLPALNTTGVITLYGITSTDPTPMVSWDPNNVFIDCPADVCTELSYSGGVFVFNVSHFTLFGSRENATPVPPGPSGGGGGSGGQYAGIPRWPAPPAGQMPVQPCVENWECEDWSRCENGVQSRVCVELNGCGTEHKPQTEHECAVERVLKEEQEAPMEMPELRPEQEQPAPEPKSGLYTLLPIFIDSALIVLALLVIISILIGTEKRANKALRLAIDLIMVAALAMVLWHYVANNEFLAMQTITFIILLIAVTTMWLTDYLKSRQKQVPEVEFESTAPVLPDGVERIEEPSAPLEMPEPAVQPMHLPQPDAWRPSKSYMLEPVEKEQVAREKPAKKAKVAPKARIVQPRREIPERMDIDSVLKRSKITLKKLDKTLKSIRKKKIRKK